MKEDITMAKLLKTTFTLFLALAFVFSFTSCKKEKAESAQSIDKNYMGWSGNRLILLDETLRE